MSPKTLTGAELQLDDGPAREAELFLVDGNNLAYRAFFALPEELATTEGFPTNALLGFTNMLFKLLSDYRPKGVAVAWDTRPVHRHEQLETYKGDRRAMPDLLREQFPYFRPIVEAFGYRNLEFEGWEADDVIATLATRADEAGDQDVRRLDRPRRVPARDRHVCLMMTPRGVSDVHVYTPERVEARYGIRPDQIPDFIGLKGDTSDNIPGIPGIGDKTAGQLVAQYGSLEEVIEHADELSPARRKNVIEHAEQPATRSSSRRCAATSSSTCDPPRSCSRRPTARQLREMFRRFEFRNLLNRIDQLDEAVPAAAARRVGEAVAWREGEIPGCVAGVGPSDRRRSDRGRDDGGRRRSGRRWPPARRRPRRRPRLQVAAAADVRARRGHADRRVPDRAGPAGVRARRPRCGVRRRGVPEPSAEEETTALVRAAETARRLAPLLRERLVERGIEQLYRDDRAAADGGARGDGGRRRQDRRVPHGRDHGAAARPGRGARAAGVRARGRGVHDRLDAAGGADPVREARADAGPQGQDRLLDRHARAALDPGRARDRRRDRGVARDWKLLNFCLEPLPSMLLPRTAACTRRSTSTSPRRAGSRRRPNLQAIPVRTELGREIRQAFVAEPGHGSSAADYSQIELRILAHVSGEPKLREAFARGEDIHRATAAEVLGKARGADDRRAVDREDGQLGIIYGISAFGLSETLEIPREEAQEYIDAYLARFPTSRTSSSGRSSRRGATGP